MQLAYGLQAIGMQYVPITCLDDVIEFVDYIL